MSDEEGKRPRGRERFRNERNYDHLDHDGARGGGGGGGGGRGGGGGGGGQYRRYGGGPGAGDRYYGGQMGGMHDDHYDRRRRERDFDHGKDRGDAVRARYNDREELPLPKKKGQQRDSKDDEEPITFREFLLLEREDISPEEAKVKYEEYIAQIRRKQPKLFFEDHKMEEWFYEKYHPAAVRARAKVIREETAVRARDFKRDVEERGTTHFSELVSDLVKDEDREKRPEADDETKAGVSEAGAPSKEQESAEKKTRDAKDGEAEQDEGEDTSKHADIVDTVFLRGVPPKVARAQLEKELECDGECKLVKLRLGDVQVHRGLTRFAWAKYESTEDAKKACDFLRGKSIKEAPVEGSSEEGAVLYRFEPVMNKDRDRRVMRTNILPKIAASAPRLRHDTEQVEKVMRHMDKYREVEELNPLTPEFLETVTDDTRKLDLCVHYLHKVHLYSYYSGLEYVEDPSAQPLPATRPRIDPNVEIALSGSGEKGNWERKVDDRVTDVLARSTDRPRSQASDGSKQRDKRLNEWFDTNTKFEGDGRYRCLLPPKKLFRGVEFVHKHLRLRHTEAMEKVLEAADEEQFLENYLHDPNRVDGSSVQDHPLPATNRPPMRGGYMPPARGGMGGGGGGAMFGMNPRPANAGGFFPSWGRGGIPPFLPGRGRGMLIPPPMNVGMDPRAARMPAYNDLDAPAEGPNIHLVKYDER